MKLFHDPRLHLLGRPGGPSTTNHKRLASILDYDGLQSPPTALDVNTKTPGQIGMFGNDTLGNCCAATIAGKLVTDAAQNGFIIDFATSEVTRFYRGSGYDGTEATDNGWTLAGAGYAAQHDGLTDTVGQRHVLGPATQVNYLNDVEVRTAMLYLGALRVGVNLAQIHQHQDVWDDDGLDTSDRKPGSWGGHSLLNVQLDEEGGLFRTWGMRKRFTKRFWNRYVDEVMGDIDPVWCSDTRLSPAGFNIADLLASMPLYR